MLDEVALRKESFTEGTKVKLGDGQEWTFPRPWLTLYPTRDSLGNFRTAGGIGFGIDYQDKLDELFEIDEDETFRRLELQLHLAATLLCANYELTDKDIRHLIPLDTNSDVNVKMWGEVNAIIACASPKLSADGSALP